MVPLLIIYTNPKRVRDRKKNHEFDIVKMRGYFKEERFFVQKQKDGKDGYAIFAPFVTSHANNQSSPLVTFAPANASGIMVNLGWVPLENRGEVALDDEPLGKLVIFSRPSKQ